LSILYNVACKVYISLSSLFDKKLDENIDFAQWVSKKELNFVNGEGNQYMPSTFHLKAVLKKLNINKNDKVLDVGCGKGKAMYMMSLFPFERVDGIDLSNDLVAIANNNFNILKNKKCRAICSNALTFDKYEDYNVFYFYNPFPEEIFAGVVEKIKESYKKQPRKITCIYMNPICDDVIKNSGIFETYLVKKSIISWFEIRCYISRT
jgi:SAM-dependent methyltransferase